METVTNNTPAKIQVDPEMVVKKRNAWGNLGVQIYENELGLQVRAQQSLAKLKTPTKIEEVAEAEKIMREVRAEAAQIQNDRKAITSKFDDVSRRLMENEKSFLEPLDKVEKAIIKIKKDDQERVGREQAKQQALAKCKEFLLNTRNNADAAFKQKILENVDKYYKHALGKGNVELEMLPEFITLVLTKMTDLDFKISYPLNAYSDKINTDEYTKLCNEILIIDPKPYLAHWENELRKMFSDYDVALKNKDAAIQLATQQKETQEQEIQQENSNANTSAKLELFSTASSIPVNPVQISGLRDLKKAYELDMEENAQNAIAIWAAFTANLDKCLPELRVNKWFACTPSQIGTALAKVKTKDENFNPSGIIFKAIDKL